MNERERRSFVDRLRTARGPSFDVLVALDRHRVLTTGQVAQLSDAPVRTTSYRLGRLQAARLVACARPGREAGSSPRHWWLTRAGALLVAGSAPADGRRPSAMFAAHAAAIAGVWLAVLEHGPAAGIAGTGWRPDRSGWWSWHTGGRAAGPSETITPDAVLLAELTVPDGPAGPTAALIEVDLGTETQTQLGRKIGRYLTYAGDRAWSAAGLPHCPPLLLLTTTQARAQTWLKAAAKASARARRGAGLDYRWAGYGSAGREVATAERLVIAACGMVHTPAAAVTDLVWQLAAGHDDADGDGQAVTLAQLLAERVTTGKVAGRWYARLAADTRTAQRTQTLRDIAHADQLGRLLGDERAADVARRLIHDRAAPITTTHPRLTRLLLDWWPDASAGGRRRTARDEPPAAAGGVLLEEIRGLLLAEHARIWAEQVRTVLAAPRTPRLAAAAAVLHTGDLLDNIVLDAAADGHDPTGESRRRTLAGYEATRDAAVTDTIAGMGWLDRRRADRTQLAAAYDEQHLLACDVCAAAVPRRTPPEAAVIARWGHDAVDDHDDVEPGDTCPACHHGRLQPYAHRHQVPTLDARLEQLRDRLSG